MSEVDLNQNYPFNNYSEPIETNIVNRKDRDEESKIPIKQDFSENTDWSAIARKLRNHNTELVKKLVKLEQNLSESQEELEAQKRRLQNTEYLILEHTDELNQNQQKINRLLHELDISQQNAQDWQNAIETLSTQLAASQEQVAKIERECSILQESYNEQNYKLIQSEQQTKELNLRLYRQQRYTLQYKAALDKLTGDTSTHNLEDLQSDTTLIPKLQPVQAWSLSEEQLEYVVEMNLQSAIEGIGKEVESWQVANSDPEETVKSQHTISAAIDLPSFNHEKAKIDSESENLAAHLTTEKEKVSKVTVLTSEKTEPTATSAKSTNQDPEIVTAKSKSSSPSPIISAASSPHKKRKTLAAIELPRFPRSQYSPG